MNTKYRLVVTPWGRQGNGTGKKTRAMVQHFQELGEKK